MSEEAGKTTESHETEASGRERRIHPRLPADQLPFTAAFAPGPDVRLIDLSRGGARFECERRLLPGSTVALRLVTPDGAVVVRGRVVRSRIAKIDQTGLVYEVAAAFNETLTALADEPAPQAAAAEPAPASASEPAATDNAGAGGDPEHWSAEITTFTATVTQSSGELREIFNGNDW
ncbi:MAG TPA: PilZ domain-containing protein [Vicinamibacterales bacterium]|nr:PilZ domain-containing protein [Vicinamibacterales bacterium]